MSILIEGMEMQPDGRYTVCVTHDSHGVVHWVFQNQDTLEFLKHGTVTEVPEPHGRLIDADALHKLFEDQWHYLQVLDWNENPTAEAVQSGINWCINTMHDDAPTIIPASEDSE